LTYWKVLVFLSIGKIAIHLLPKAGLLQCHLSCHSCFSLVQAEVIPSQFQVSISHITSLLHQLSVTKIQGCGAGTGRNRIHLGTLEPEPEPYSEYGSGSEYKEMKQTTQKN
jgi:hypothetical protein